MSAQTLLAAPRLAAGLFPFALALLLCLPATAQRAVVLGGSGLNRTISDGDNSPRTADGTDFGDPVNVTGSSRSISFRIRNDDGAPGFLESPTANHVFVTSITSTNSEFAMSSAPIVGGIPHSGGFANFTLRFDPANTGTRTATITINTLGEDPYTFAVRGVGIGFPEMNLTGNGLTINDGDSSPRAADGTDWGTVTGPASFSRTFRVTNTGTAPLTLSEFSDSIHWSVSGLSSSLSAGSGDNFTVTYNPRSSGTHTGTIRIENNDPNEDPYTFAVRGLTRAPEIQVLGGQNRDDNITRATNTPTITERTDFGSIDINGGPVTRIFRIRNTETSDGNPGTGNLIVSSITATRNTPFTVPFQIVPPISEGGFFDFNVRFDPSTVGSFSAVVTIDNNDIDGNEDPYTFNIRGVGVGSPEIEVHGRPNPVLAFLPINDGDTTPEIGNGTVFGSRSVTAGAVSHQVRIRNTGSAPLTVSATENSPAFSISGLGTSIAPGGSDIFNVTFNPSSPGTFTTDIVIDTNDPDGGEDPYTFRVSGTGTAPEIEVRGGAGFARVINDNDNTPGALDFTNFGARDILASPLNRNFQIRNTGNQNLVISSVTVSNNPTFAVVSAPIAPIPPGGNATFTVGFDPSTVGTHDAQVTIQNNDSNEGTYNFAITGEGIGSPEIAVFGKPLGPLDGVAIANNDLEPDLADNTSFGPLDVNLGPVTHVFRIKNIGSTNLTIGLTSSNPAFSLSSVVSFIAPGAADDFNVTFDPSTTGEQSADLIITNNDPDGGENPYTFRVGGTGIGPDIEVDGGRFLSIPIQDGDNSPRVEDHTDFGLVEIGEDPPVDQEFQIGNNALDDLNPATQNLVIDSINLIGPSAAHFSIISPPILAPLLEGSNASLFIRYNPTESGTHNATVIIQNNDPEEDPYTYAIRGEATSSAEIRTFALGALNEEVEILSGNTNPRPSINTNFGTPDLNGPPTDRRFRIKNTGNQTLTLVPSVVGDQDFEVSDLAPTIPPGGADDFQIVFDPASSGERSATISIDNNDPDGNEDPFTFLVIGEGRAPEIAVFGGLEGEVEILDEDDTPRPEDGTNFGEAELTLDPVDHSFVIRNLQDRDGLPLTGSLTLSSITITGDGTPHFAVLPRLPVPIEEESFGILTIRFAPTTPGTHRATVTITHNDPDDGEAPFNFDIVGVGTGQPVARVYGLPTAVTDGVPIASGDTTPSAEDGTDFGNAALPIPAPTVLAPGRFFRLRNTGIAPLTFEVNFRDLEIGNDESTPFLAFGEDLNRVIQPGLFRDFPIYFWAKTSGLKRVQCEITTNDPTNELYTFVLQGFATAPEIEVFGGDDFSISILSGDSDPQAADGTDFGDVAVDGQVVSRVFRIRNLEPDDEDPTTLNSLILSDINGIGINLVGSGEDFFRASAVPEFPVLVPVGAGQFFDLEVFFDPSSPGRHNTFVEISHSDPDDEESPYIFAITGNGIEGDPDIAVFGNPIPLISDGLAIENGDDTPIAEDNTDFGHRDVFAILDRVHTFRIRNHGFATLDATAALDSPQFEITEPLDPTITPGGFDDFNITYNPQESGVHTATVTITSDDPDESSYTFRITGRAFAPEIQVHGGNGFEVEILDGDMDPGSADGTEFGEVAVSSGSVEHSFRIRNNLLPGGLPVSGNLILSELSVSNLDNFSIVAGAPLPGIPIVITPGQFHEFTVRFDPSDGGLQSSIVIIRNNDPDGDENPFDFFLQGTGLGEPEIVVTGLPIPFIFDGVPIENGSTEPMPANGTDFGRELAGSLINDVANNFRLRNLGTGPLDVAISIDSDQFELTIPPAGDSVPPNDFRDFTILFNPGETGIHTATVTIANNDPTGDEDPYTFRIAGVGYGPEITVVGGENFDHPIRSGSTNPTPDARTDLGGSLLPGSLERTFRILNVTRDFSLFSGQLSVFSITVTNPEVFSISTGAPVQPIPVVVPVGGFHEFNVRFTPTEEGEFRGVVTIQHDDPDGDEFPYTFEIVARAGDPDIHVSSEDVRGVLREIENGDMNPSRPVGTEFPAVLVGERATNRIRIFNGGGSDLVLTLSTDNPEFWPAFRDEERTVPMNTHLTFDMIFDPTAPGMREAIVTITSNDPDESPYTFKMAGEAIGPDLDVFGGPDLDLLIDPGDLTPSLADQTDFGRVAVDSQRTHTFRLHNPGNRTVAISIELANGSDPEFTLEESQLPTSLSDGDSEEFSITFSPTAPGPRRALVQIEHDGPEPSPYTFEVVGNGLQPLPLPGRLRPKLTFDRNPQNGGFASGRISFHTEADKSYRIVTTTNLRDWETILTGITGIGDILSADLTPWLPSETNQTRLFRVEEE